MEKISDTLGRGLRAALLQSGRPFAFWKVPHFRQTGKHPDMLFFRPFGCARVVFRGKDLLEHRKLAPWGEKSVYLGTGKQFGRRAFMYYSA